MGLNDSRAEAEKLYVRQSLFCNAIAKRLGVNDGTVYRWKQAAAGCGDNSNREIQRRVYNMSTKELIAICSETVKAWIVRLKMNPDLRGHQNHGAAKNRQARTISWRCNRFNQSDERMARPELKAQLADCWDWIYQAMVAYSTDKGVL